MVIRELRARAAAELKNACVTDTPELDVLILMKQVWGLDEIGLVIHGADLAEDALCKRFFELLERRKTGEPIAYLCGKKEFMSLEFAVDPHVLIPRPDTECVVEQAIRLCGSRHVKILDLCSGSGCIAISLAKYLPNAEVFGAELSEGALRCAEENAARLGVQVPFSRMDVLREEPTQEFDVIVSNPPYIRSDVIPTLQRDVIGFEPHLALDGGEDGLLFYRRIIPMAAEYLTPNGILILEIGFDQAREVAALIASEAVFSEPFPIRDTGSRDRGVYALKNK